MTVVFFYPGKVIVQCVDTMAGSLCLKVNVVLSLFVVLCSMSSYCHRMVEYCFLIVF